MFPCLNVRASETDTVIDLNELYGLTIEEMYEELDETGAFISAVPSTLDTGNYNVEENISLSSGGISCTYVNSNGTYSTTLPFGYSLAVYNVAKNITCTLYNNGNPLFTNGGTLYLNLSSYATTIVMYVTYTDGGGYSEQFTGNWSSGSASIEIVVNNSDADISKIQFMYSGAIQQSNGDYALRGGIFKYGYILDEVETGNETAETTKDIFSLLQSFISNFWTNILDKTTESLEPITNWISSFWTNIKTNITSVFQPLFNYISSFWDNITEKLDYLRDQIVSIFVPDDDYFQNWLEEQYNFLVDKFGALGYLQTYIIDLFNAFYNAEFGEPVLTCPAIELDVPNFGHYVIMEEKVVNFNELTDGFDVALEMLRFATSAIYCFALGGYALRVKDDILR